MSLEKPKIFLNNRNMILSMLILVVMISVRLIFTYSQYTSFLSKEYFFLDGRIISSYQKNNDYGKYTVLKIKSTSGLTFFTTYDKYDNYNNAKIRAKIYPNQDISFWNYLGYFYTKSEIKKIDKSSTKNSTIQHWISSQHSSSSMKSFFNGIYLATPLRKDLRIQISKLGSSHLVALSGFHIGILWGIIYLCLSFPYKFFQKKYFPHRYLLRDVGGATLILLGFYVWYVGAPPSLTRSFAMTFIGWCITLLGIELVSFEFLSTAALLLLLLNPGYIASISFWLSVLGVFYIFLILKWCSIKLKLLISVFCIPVGIFILMQPLVHYIFPISTPYQLLSPALSIAFVLFYPATILLHLIGQGGVLDSLLAWLISSPSSTKDILTPLWLILPYITVSVLSTRYIYAFYTLMISAITFTLYLFV